MLCEKCLKNEANISVKTMINGVVKTYQLCSECAQKQGLFQSGFGFENFPMSNYLGQALFNFPFSTLSSQPKTIGTKIKKSVCCPACGQKFADFKTTGLFGCPECYSTFHDVICSMLDQIHGGHIHNATQIAPDYIEVAESKPLTEIEQLKSELKEKIQLEQYEEAAVLRDKIKELTAAEKSNAANNIEIESEGEGK
ncbi:MAG TPA: excinuclease ABC subunit B [Clostridiaceae bacterium]|jgi:protein arginine kinase activator|nr:excinuclease ABC subunit B [Clostridiaceae bacterium]